MFELLELYKSDTEDIDLSRITIEVSYEELEDILLGRK